MPPPTNTPTPSPAEVEIENRVARKYGREKERNAQLTQEIEGLKATIAGLTTENADLKIKADTSLSSKRVAELEQEIRVIGHRKIFDRVARAKEANLDGLDDLWTLVQGDGYKATGDPDEAAMGLLLDEQKAKRAYLFNGKADPNAPPPKKPGPASGQAQSPGTNPYVMEDDDPRISDVKWQMANFSKIAEAAVERSQQR